MEKSSDTKLSLTIKSWNKDTEDLFDFDTENINIVQASDTLFIKTVHAISRDQIAIRATIIELNLDGKIHKRVIVLIARRLDSNIPASINKIIGNFFIRNDQSKVAITSSIILGSLAFKIFVSDSCIIDLQDATGCNGNIHCTNLL